MNVNRGRHYNAGNCWRDLSLDASLFGSWVGGSGALATLSSYDGGASWEGAAPAIAAGRIGGAEDPEG